MKNEKLANQVDVLEEIVSQLENFQGRIYTCSNILLKDRYALSQQLYDVKSAVEYQLGGLEDLLDSRGGI